MMDLLRESLGITSTLVLLLVMLGFPLYGLARRVPVYESFVTGARDGFTTAVNILPYLVAIFFAVAMFRASGALDGLTSLLRPGLDAVGFPPELLPMALIRPMTGSGSIGVLSENITTYGVDSQITAMSATIYGSTETTFYIIAVYFGSVGIKRIRHALAAGLLADFAAVVLAVMLVRVLVP